MRVPKAVTHLALAALLAGAVGTLVVVRNTELAAQGGPLAPARATTYAPVAAVRAPAKPAAGKVFNVVEFGALTDGKTLNTPPINAAIDAAAAAGGGTVEFPAGRYMSGTIRLTSRVHLKLHKDAVLIAAPSDVWAYEIPHANPHDEYQDFGHSHFRNALIWGDAVQDVSITGGTIEGAALERGEPPLGGADKAISLKSCKSVTLDGIAIREGGHFAILATDCDGMKIANLNIRTSRDGIDLVGCRNVELHDSEIRCLRYRRNGGNSPVGGDDAIALKSDYSLGKTLISENIRIWKCKLSTACNAIQFGSETAGDFRNIRVSDIEIEHADKAAIGIQSNDGGIIDGVAIENVRMTKAATPLFINITARLRTPEKKMPGAIRNVVIRNVTSTDTFGYIKDRGYAATISGLREHRVENVLLENVKIVYKGGGAAADAEVTPEYLEKHSPEDFGPRPAYGFYVRDAKGIEFRNVELTVEKDDLRPAMTFDGVTDAVFNGVKAQRAAGSEVDVLLRNGSKPPMVKASDGLKIK